MQITNEKKKLKKKNSHKIFILILQIFFREKIIFFNANFLTKFNRKSELNKFKTQETQLNKSKVR